jgi:acyl dehydratase
MNPLVINSFEEFEQYAGKDLGYSDYLTITQEQINMFADATLDHQWIHTDPVRAATESPFKTTIAHGYLNVSILPYLWQQIVEVRNVKLLVNYGIENLKFIQPVTVNSQVRVHAKLESIVNLRGVAKTHLKIKLEIKDSVKPAMEAVLIFLYHFNKD